MVATRRKLSAALISSTSLLSPLPFSANTRDFSVSRTLEKQIVNGKIIQEEVNTIEGRRTHGFYIDFNADDAILPS